ncbi:uncharacterized protein BXZ73DRAFT_81791 [Epithele typhae]|uniref:uncharacterized protein n=1 Tax=Epithele typhae TaxID=378194 RepID=UPI002008A532|nr:uncharacterized protein BXZ73DRAFT_81791 [Epithele typhae]KAH9913994.1 hypothetical protein BXZ73DRAFT_81791 [Epithele typhae]
MAEMKEHGLNSDDTVVLYNMGDGSPSAPVGQESSDDDVDRPKLPVHIFPESVHVVLPVLSNQSSIPTEHYLRAAHNHGLHKLESHPRSTWAHHMPSAPLRFFFFAAERDWHREAQSSARTLIASANNIRALAASRRWRAWRGAAAGAPRPPRAVCDTLAGVWRRARGRGEDGSAAGPRGLSAAAARFLERLCDVASAQGPKEGVMEYGLVILKVYRERVEKALGRRCRWSCLPRGAAWHDQSEDCQLSGSAVTLREDVVGPVRLRRGAGPEA